MVTIGLPLLLCTISQRWLRHCSGEVIALVTAQLVVAHLWLHATGDENPCFLLKIETLRLFAGACPGGCVWIRGICNPCAGACPGGLVLCICLYV